MKKKRHTKIISCSLKGGRRERELGYPTSLSWGWERNYVLAVYIYREREHRVIRLVQQVTQENHILLATANNFRSFLSSHIRATFFFFILED